MIANIAAHMLPWYGAWGCVVAVTFHDRSFALGEVHSTQRDYDAAELDFQRVMQDLLDDGDDSRIVWDSTGTLQ